MQDTKRLLFLRQTHLKQVLCLFGFETKKKKKQGEKSSC